MVDRLSLQSVLYTGTSAIPFGTLCVSFCHHYVMYMITNIHTQTYPCTYAHLLTNAHTHVLNAYRYISDKYVCDSCMYIFVTLCMHVRMYMCLCMHVMHLHVYRTHAHIAIHTRTCTFTCTHTTHTYILVYVETHALLFHMRTHTNYVYMCTFRCAMCAITHTYPCLCVYKWKNHSIE